MCAPYFIYLNNEHCLLSYKGCVHHAGREEAGTWHHGPWFLSTDFEPVCVVKAPGTPCCSPADGLLVVRRPPSTAAIWFPARTFNWNRCYAGAVRHIVSYRPWWYCCANLIGFFRGFRYGRPLDTPTASANNLRRLRHCSQVVSVVSVRPFSVCPPRPDTVICHLSRLRCPAGVCARSGPIHPLHCWSGFPDWRSLFVAASLCGRLSSLWFLSTRCCGRTLVTHLWVCQWHCHLDQVEPTAAKPR